MVTGAGGFIGAAVVAEVLARGPETTVNALVHSPTSAERLLARLNDDRRRVHVMVGDIAQPGFGMTDADARRIADGTSAIIHTAAEVNHYKTYEALRAANVEAVTTAAQLAWNAGGGSVPLVFTSSISVDADEAAGSLSSNGYARGKQIAERRLAHAAEQGLPVRVLRVGRALPDSRDGAFNPNDTLEILFSACLAVGATPPWAFCEAAHPVDVVARALVDAALAPVPAGAATFELRYPPMGLWSSRDLLRAIQRTASLRAVDWDEWAALVQADGGSSAQRAVALMSVNSRADLMTDNSAEVRGEIAHRGGDILPDFDASYYEAMAAGIE